jgi:hypothetical protein
MAQIGPIAFHILNTRVWFRAPPLASLWRNRGRGGTQMHALIARAQVAGHMALGRLARRGSQRGQGTVEYVGLILLVALLMVGMVAAMKGFQGKQGIELAETIVDRIREAVNQVSFK